MFAPAEEWQNDEYRVDVDYHNVSPPLSVPSVTSELLPLLPDKYSPLTRTGSGAQGYLFPLSPQSGRFLLGKIKMLYLIRD